MLDRSAERKHRSPFACSPVVSGVAIIMLSLAAAVDAQPASDGNGKPVGTVVAAEGQGMPVEGAGGGSAAQSVIGREAVAARVEGQPTVDGDVLNDPAWSRIEPLTTFWQKTPNEGQPSSERTEVRVAYTPDTLYFGVVLYDRTPDGIITSDARRDGALEETDSFQIILDTYHDRQNGFLFGTNPAGLEYDGQVINEGEGSGGMGGGGGGGGGGQQRGAGGGFNLNWDGAWQVRTQTSDIGWSAEFAIPFRTLRYAGGSDQTWGINFQRNIRRHKEESFWSPVPRQYNIHRLSQAGTLTGLQIAAQRNFKVMPYVLGEALAGGPRTDTTYLGDVGIDAKYSLTPSLTLDATYNTDFAQVEVDELQINLDRFNLFFPEKRPFFLENAGLFAVGDPGDVEVFFSRRIGIGPSGETIPILGGARVSGQVAGTSIGLLNMQTEELPGVTPSNNFGVARVRRDLPNRSSVGGIFVNRQAMGDLAGDDDYNRTYAFDARWGLGRNALVNGFFARSITPGISDEDYAFALRGRRDTQGWTVNMGYSEVGDNFNPEVGFLRREGYRRFDGNTMLRVRPSNFIGIHELRPHINSRNFWNHDGFHETGYLHFDQHWEWRSGHEIHTGMNITREGLLEPFEIYPDIYVPPGTYDHKEAQIVAFTNQGQPVSVRFDLTAGGFFGGDRVQTEPQLTMRVGEAFNTTVGWQRNDIDLPWGAFVTNLGRWRMSYSFSPRVFAQSLIQYNDRADIWSMNFRFGWLQEANSGLFVVFNDTRGLGSLDPHLRSEDAGGRSFVIKFSRLIDILQ